MGFGAVLSIGLTSHAFGQDTPKAGFVLLTEADTKIAPTFGNSLSFSNTGGHLSVDYFAPLRQNAQGALMFDGGLNAAGTAGAGNADGYVGLAYR